MICNDAVGKYLYGFDIATMTNGGARWARSYTCQVYREETIEYYDNNLIWCQRTAA